MTCPLASAWMEIASWIWLQHCNDNLGREFWKAESQTSLRTLIIPFDPSNPSQTKSLFHAWIHMERFIQVTGSLSGFSSLRCKSPPNIIAYHVHAHQSSLHKVLMKDLIMTLWLCRLCLCSQTKALNYLNFWLFEVLFWSWHNTKFMQIKSHTAKFLTLRASSVTAPFKLNWESWLWLLGSSWFSWAYPPNRSWTNS